MRRRLWGGVVVFLLALAAPALAVEIEVHGDLNNRFNLYTDQARFFGASETIGRATELPGDPAIERVQLLDDDAIEETWGEIKYRLWAEMATNDGRVKGVYAIELGALRYGNNFVDTRGSDGAFSGDGVNIETRWAYTDIALPEASRASLRLGLFSFTLNPFLWSETAMGVMLTHKAKPLETSLAWTRGREVFNDVANDDWFEDVDALSGRVVFTPAEKLKAGFFALWQRSDPGSNDGAPGEITPGFYLLKSFGPVALDVYSLGTDGGWAVPTGLGNLFIDWDLIYQTGSIDEATFDYSAFGLGSRTGDFDLSAWFAHADVGVDIGRLRLAWTGWYASGDDDPTDGDFEGFLATDVDRADSIILFEGGYTDDNYFTERPYLLDKGLILNKLAADYKPTEKFSFGGAVLYLLTAEDIPLAGGAESDKIGTEIDAYVTYMLYSDVEVSLNAGYLFADDAMDAFELAELRDGEADADIFRSTARVRYKF